VHLVITLHGIRTFGGWQDRLQRLVKEADKDIEVRSYRYNYFSSIGFLFPPARWLVTRRFRKELIRTCAEESWDRVDIVAHSFGTHIAAWALRGLSAKDRPRIHTIILAGSVLKSNFPWVDLIPGSLRRLVNECGSRDDVLILSQFFSLFTGMAGRVGFIGMERDNFANRFYSFGHGGYFQDIDGDPDRFMRDRWIPLLTADAPIERTPPREAPTAVSGLFQFLIDNAEPIKLLVYVVPLVVIILWINSLRVLAVARQLAAQSDLVLRSSPDQTELAALLAAESMRREPLIENEEAVRNAIAILPRSLPHPGREAPLPPYLWSFSPDGRFVVTASSETDIAVVENGQLVRTINLGHANALSVGAARVAVELDDAVAIADLTTGQEIARFSHGEPIGKVSFSADGRFLLTMSGKRETVEDPNLAARMPWRARVFDVDKKTEIHLPNESFVSDATLSPSGKFVAFAHMFGQSIDIVELNAELKVASITETGMKEVSDMSFSQEEKYLTAEGDDMFRRRAFDLQTGKTLSYIPKEARAIAFSSDSGLAVVGCDDGYIRLYRAADGRPLWQFDEGANVDAVAFSPDGRFIASGALDNTARVLDVRDGREQSRLKHDGRVFAVAFSPDGRYVATGNDDLTARVFRVESGAELARFIPGSPPGKIAFSKDGNYVGTGWGRGGVFGVEAGEEESEKQFPSKYLNLMALSFTPDGRQYTVGTQTPDVLQVYDRGHSQHSAQTFSGHNSAFTPDNRYLATGGYDGTARLYDRRSGHELGRFLVPDLVSAAALSFDTKFLAVATNGGVRVFDVQQKKLITRLDAGSDEIVFTADGKAFVVDGPDGVTIIDTISGRVIKTFKNTAGPFAISPDDKYLAAATSRDDIGVFDVHNTKQVFSISGLDYGPKLAFSPDGRYLAVASDHLGNNINETAVYDLAKRRDIAHVRSRGTIGALSFSPDGRAISTVSELKDNTVLVSQQWVYPKELLTEVCSRLIRNLSREEWEKYLAVGFYQQTCPNLPRPEKTKSELTAAPPESPAHSSKTEMAIESSPILAKPTLITPADRTVFDVRQTTVRWNPVPGASSYIVQVDYCQATDAWIESGGVWCEDGNQNMVLAKNITTTEYSFYFVGEQPGRWRVWAVDQAGRVGPSSAFRTFRYTQ
jgi:WD40 repeat protein